MPKFFLPDANGRQVGDVVVITGSDAHHISKTLRMKKGERLTLTSSDSTDYQAVIENFSESDVFLRVESLSRNESEPPVFSRLFQALAKGDKMDVVIQKAVELGVSEFYPVASARCVVQADEKKAQKKHERWQRIAEEAAKQCGRGIIPQVYPIISFKDAVLEMKKSELYFICYEASLDKNPRALFSASSFASLAFFIGPEGGISPEELEFAHSEGVRDVTLGKRILRTETASSTVLSMLLYETEF